MEYEHTLVIAFAFGIWGGMLATDDWIDEELDLERTSQPMHKLVSAPLTLIVIVGVWTALAALQANSLMGFVHLSATPIGLAALGCSLIIALGRLYLALAQGMRWSAKNIRRWATVIGLTLFLGSCVAIFEADPCSDEDAYCPDPEWS